MIEGPEHEYEYEYEHQTGRRSQPNNPGRPPVPIPV